MISAHNAETKPAEILVAEDSTTQAEQLKYVLERHGYKVRVAADGEQALAAAREHKPTLILSDVMMPGMDGYALCKRIKANEELQDTPVILITSLSSPQDILQGLDCGADNFVTKPYEATYLLARIDHILASRRVAKAEKVQFGAKIFFGGRTHFITAEQQQILGLLLSSYEEAVRISQELKAREKDLAHSYQVLRALHAITGGLNEAVTEQKVLETALEHAMKLPGVQAGWISLWRPDGGLSLVAARGLPPALELPGALDANCVCHHRQLAGETKEVPDVEECECLQKAGGATLGLRFHATIPLLGEDRTLGFMNLAGPEAGIFRQKDLGIFQSVGGQVAVALQRAHLLEELEKKVEARTAALRQEVAQRRRSEMNYRTLFESANDSIIIFEPENETILEANTKACATYGFSKQELIGKSLKALTEDVPRGERQISQIMGDGTYKDFETVHRSKDGTLISMLCNSSVIEYEGKKAILSINHDITERKRLDLQLRQAQKLEAIGLLAGGVAHDFNNLLGVILGYSELLLEAMDAADPQRKELEQIRKAADSAVSITRQLLALGRRQVLQPRVVDLNSMVTDLEGMLRRLIGEDIKVVVNPSPALAKIRVDPGQIEQVIINLAVNARDAMPRGGTLAIETANVQLDETYRRQHPVVPVGDYVMLAVSDTGAGMDAQTQARIFEPFFTTKEMGKGTGLGLATVYGTVKQSGGYIWVYSELGKGTIFKIYLPQVEAPPPKAQSPEVVHELPAGPKTVLLVEDAEALREFARQLLEKCGYKVLEAEDAKQALELAERWHEPIDLLLTDVVMPGMSGPELAERLAATHAETKVLCVSGYANEVLQHRDVIKAGMAFLQKPFTRDALAGKIRELLGTRPQALCKRNSA
jgi:PAS domain S-box-containing protein